jgi:ABC-type phosphate/phosphonate transport system substrate-binding protein
MGRATVVVLSILGALVAAPRVAAAQQSVTIGLFAPTAPFDGSGDRVSFVSGLADHLSGDGRKVTGKVYTSAAAFSSAVKKGEIQFAVVDAPYAAALGLPYKILASAVRDGSSTTTWQLVAGAKIARLRDLKGKKVVVPSIGAKDSAFVTNAMLEGEVDAAYFDKILEAADLKSALTMVTVGKADAALVPGGVDLPAGTSRVMSLASVGWPMFVALPGNDDTLVKAFAAKAKTFSSTGTFSGFAGPDAGRYRSLAGSFGKASKKGPMVVPPPARLTVRDLLDGRTFTIPQTDVLDLVEAPKPASPTPAPTPSAAPDKRRGATS